METQTQEIQEQQLPTEVSEQSFEKETETSPDPKEEKTEVVENVEEIAQFSIAIPKNKFVLMKILFAIFIVLMLVLLFNSLLKAFSRD